MSSEFEDLRERCTAMIAQFDRERVRGDELERRVTELMLDIADLRIGLRRIVEENEKMRVTESATTCFGCGAPAATAAMYRCERCEKGKG